MHSLPTEASERPRRVDFADTPFVVIWETTQACDLACRHCRAEASPGRDPQELSTDEGKGVIEEAAAMGAPIFVLSGGDPLKRPDLEELVVAGKARGMRMATIPAATEGLTRERIDALARAGLDQIAFSLDGSDAGDHDGFRRVEGSFDKTMNGVEWAHQAGIPLQINTCIAGWNHDHLEKMIDLVKGLGLVFWEVFFLVPTGRGRELDNVEALRCESIFERLWRLNQEVDFIVKVTEAPHYRRFVMEKEASEKGDGSTHERVRHVLARPRGVGGSIGMSPQAVNSGKGFLFIDHRGNIMPSGFLPIVAGNVRNDSLAAVYRDSELFRRLRDPSLLKGRCGACSFASVCGGSRARAYAVSGDYLGEDSLCAYDPAAASSAAAG